jgi:hypothetical protein
MLAIGSIAGMAVGSPAQAETEYTPSVSLSQRYNSNIWNTAQSRIPRGKQAWDLVTTLRANVIILNKSRLGDTEVRAGVDGNVYAYNTDLAYASGNVHATSDMSDWTHELLPGLKLRISDAFRYTPNQAAFPIGVHPQEGVTPQPGDIFTRGIEPARANTWSNSLSTDGDYSFSRSTGLRANYTFSMLRFGRVYVTQVAPSGALNYFDTTAHNFAIGPTYTFDGGDTLFLKYNYLTSELTSITSSRSPRQFTSQSIQPEYVTKIAQHWTARISGGATMVEQASSRTFFSGSFSLTNEFDRQTQVSIGVSRHTAPAYFIVGGAFISNVAQLYVAHDFSRVTRLTVRGNYAKGESTPVKIVSFATIAGSAVLDYNLTRDTKLSLSQGYTHFNVSGTTHFSFDQFITMLMVTMEWK